VKGTIAAAILAAVLAGTPGAVAAQTSSNPDWDAGVSHFTQKQYRQSISDFQKVAEAHPEFANTYYYTGLAHFQLKEYGKAVVDLTRYVDLTEKGGGKTDVKARAALGRAYLFSNDFQKAVTVLTVVTQAVTDDPVNFYYLGIAYQKLNQNDKAIDAYSAALKLNPKDVPTLDQLTRLLLAKALTTQSKDDFNTAIARAEQLRLVRDDAQTATLLGSAYLGSGDFQKASVHLAKVVEATPQDGTAWFNYGLSLSRSKQFPKAETALVKASTLVTPPNAAVYIELGYVQESLKKYKEALASYQEADKLSPSPQLKESIERVQSVVGTAQK
jgi:tetratricopeptide (TPR) repeat protein